MDGNIPSMATSIFLNTVTEAVQNVEKQYIIKFEEQQTIISQLQKEINELKQQLGSNKHKAPIYTKYNSNTIDELLDEIEHNEEKYNKKESKEQDSDSEFDEFEEKEQHKNKTPEFWDNLQKKLKKKDIEYIKDLVRKKELSMDDTNNAGRNLLMLATEYGIAKLVSMCINLGADIDKEDNSKQTALKIAKQNGFPDIEELLIMNLLKTELGERIENTTNDLLMKRGINNNFNRILNDLFMNVNGDEKEEKDEIILRGKAISQNFMSKFADVYKEELYETLLRIILKSIEEKIAFSDDMLYICFYYEINYKKRMPIDTILYKRIKNVVLKILNDTKNKKDWYFLKHYVLKSSIWYFKLNPLDKKSKFLFYNLFTWVDNETTTQSQILSTPMRAIENKNISEWNKLISYDIKTNYAYENVRQDVVARGLKSEYTMEHLTQNVAISATFNPLTHYDLSQYLTKLVLICHEVDDLFHDHMKKIFNINKETKDNKKLGVVYMKGPVKKYERCYAKCQSDYREEKFPTAAHILDIVRCSLIFEDVSSMLFGMDLFQETIKEQEYCILEVARVKNGFFEYKHSAASYTDIKFNVLIKGKKYNIIGEVQFLFRKMADYKRIAHALYNISRTKEFVDDLSEVLPVKLDLEKQLFIHAARDNINGLTDLMVTHQFNEKALLQLNQQKQSILTPIMSTNCEKVLNFLIKTLPTQAIKERLMLPEQSKSYPLKRAIENNHYHGVLKTIFTDNKFALITVKDHEQKSILTRCWNLKVGKCSLLILNNIKSREKLLSVIEDTTAGITSLQAALRSGDKDCVQFIFDQLEYNEKLKTKLLRFKDSNSKSNFHYAAQGGNVDCIKLLLSKCQNDKQRKELLAQDNYYQLPVFDGILHGKPEIVDYLLGQMSNAEKRKFFNTKNSSGNDPIRILTARKSLEHIETLKIVMKYVESDDLRLNEVFLFAAKNDLVDLAKLLITSKTSNEITKWKMINCQNPSLECAMHCCSTQPQFLSWLLSIVGDDNPQFTNGNHSGQTPLMLAAAHCNITCCKMILTRIKHTKIKNVVLQMMDSSSRSVIDVVLANSSNKNYKQCCKLIMKYYDENDMQSIFLPCVQLGDIKLAQEIWDKTGNDKILQKKLLSSVDKDKYNCFLLVCKNGAFKSLKWLLTLNDENKNEEKEDEDNLTQKHPSNNKTPLLLCVEKDNRRESKNKQQKCLTDDEKSDYFNCVKLIFEKVKNKRILVFESDNTSKDVLHYACANANIQTVTFLLSQINDKNKKALIERRDKGGLNCFHHAIQGSNIELVEMIYNLYKKYDKHKQLMNDSMVLQLSLQEGNSDVTKYVLYTVIKNSETKIKFLNKTISVSKTTRKFTEKLRGWVSKILTIEIKKINFDIENITDLFNWILKNSPSNDLSAITQMISLLPNDEYSKSLFIKKSKCISYCCKNNRIDIIHKLLKYLDNCITPLIQSDAFIDSIDSGNDVIVDIIFKFIKKKDIKDKLISTVNKNNENALIRSIKNKNKKIMELILSNHSDIDKLLGDAFICCLQQSQADTAKYILDKSTNRTLILNYKTKEEYNNTALMYALKHQKEECLQFIVEELKQDENKEEIKNDSEESKENITTIHPMYLITNDLNENILHVMFKTECNQRNIEILESVLSGDIIYKLLSSHNIDDELPIDVAFLKCGIEIMEWILDQFNDQLEKYYMIAKRNKFNKTLLHKTTKNKSKVIQETKPFMAKCVKECLDSIDMNNLDLILIKDTFQYTIDWNYPSLQELILSKIPKNQIDTLLNRDDMLFSLGETCIHRILHADDSIMSKLILSVVTNNKQLMCHSNKGESCLYYGVNKRIGHQTIKLILDKLGESNNKILFDFITEQNRDYRDKAAVARSYANGDKQFQELLLEYLPDKEKSIAMVGATQSDRLFTKIPFILSSLSSESKSGKVRHNLIRSSNAEGTTILFISTNYNHTKIIDWIINDEVKEKDDPALTSIDYRYNWVPMNALVICGMTKFVETVFTKLTPETQLSQLFHKGYFWDGRSPLSDAVYKPLMEQIFNRVIIRLLESNTINTNDFEIMFGLFKFLITSQTANDKNIKTIQMLLSQTTKLMKIKLFCNYENLRTWNVLKETAKNEKKDVFSCLVKNAENIDIIKILNDEYNPKVDKENVLQICCKNGAVDCFNLMLSIYDDNKENSDNELIKADYNNVTPLFKSIEHGKIDLASYILDRIKNESQIIKIFNQEIKNTNKNIFDVINSEKCKHIIKTYVIALLRNINTNKIKSEAFVCYFHWLCKENDVDSIKQLLNVFKKEQNYMNKLLKSINYMNKQSPLHIACTNDSFEMIEYLLSFIRDEKQKEELFSSQDKNGETVLHLTFKKSQVECTKLILNKLKSNKTLLSQIIKIETNSTTKDRFMKTCMGLEINTNKMDCCSLLIDYNIDDEIFKMLFLIIIKKQTKGKEDIFKRLMSKIQHEKLFDDTIFLYDSDNSPLFYSLSSGNIKMAKIIMNEMDKTDEKTIINLVKYKNIKGQHYMHAACKSGNILCAKAILSMCDYFQNFKSYFRYPDNSGRNPLHIYLSDTNRKSGEISEFIIWYLSTIKKNKDKLYLITQCDLDTHKIPLDCAFIINEKFGAKLLEKIVLNINCIGNDALIEHFARILHLTIACTHTSLELIKFILNKYANYKDKIKLLSYQNEKFENAFVIAYKSKNRIKSQYILSFIDSNNTDLLLQPVVFSNKSGSTLFHNIISHDSGNDVNNTITTVFEKFDSIKHIFSITDDSNQTVFDKIAKMNLIHLSAIKELNENELVQHFIDNIKNGALTSLFGYFEDHENELIQKLLWATTKNDKETLLMTALRHISNRYLFNWILPFIKKLNNKQLLKCLNRTSIIGENIFHTMTKNHDYIEYVTIILSLYPTKQSKEEAILHINNIGKTAFMSAFETVGRRGIAVAKVMFDNLSTIEQKLQMMNPWYDIVLMCKLANFFIYKEWIKEALQNMSKKYIDNVELLISSFRLASYENNLEFAKLVISKIDPTNPNKILKFVTTKIPSINQENCLHFAAYSSFSEMMQLLFNLIENNIKNYDLNKLLLNDDIIYNKFKETPLQIALKRNNPNIINYFLSKIKNINDKLKLIELQTIYELPKTKTNYKNKNDYEITLNSILLACMKCNDTKCLHELLSNYDKQKANKLIMKYTNNKKQNIYHFVKTIQQCEYLRTHYNISFGFEAFNNSDQDGNTAFMKIVSNKECKIQFIEWILNNECKNNEEKLQLIHNYNKKGENAFDLLVESADITDNNMDEKTRDKIHLLIQTIKNVISSYKKIKDFKILMPIFLFSLFMGKLDLSNWLLSKLNNESDQRKLINGSNKNGFNGAMAACKGQKMESLQFLLRHKFIDDNGRFLITKKPTDTNGLTCQHYLWFTFNLNVTQSIQDIIYTMCKSYTTHIDIYGNMLMADKFGNTPWDYLIKKWTEDQKKNYYTWIGWIINKLYIEYGDQYLIKFFSMLFHKNKNQEIALFEHEFFYFYNVNIARSIKKLFDQIEVINEQKSDDNDDYENDELSIIEIAAYSLLYLRDNNWTISKLIISKIKNENVLFKMLNIPLQNANKYNILYNICQTSNKYIIDWYLSNIIPNNHPILYSQNTINGKTPLHILVIQNGYVLLAQKLLNKIDNKKEKLKLIKIKDNQNKSILDDAKQNNIPFVVDWIQTQIQNNQS